MSVKLDKRNTTIDSQILKGNVSPSKVYQPQWINNQTRLNQTNVELMRSNLIKYIDLVAGSLFSDIKKDINIIIDKSAGWVQINTTNGDVVGEIFNDYDNNKVATNKKYQAAFGSYTEANGNGQFVCGNANEVVEDALFIVGCGDFDYQETNDNEPQDGVTYYTLDSGTYKKFEGTNFKEGTVYYELKVDKQNALVIKEDGTVNILKDVTFDGNETFNGTVTFNQPVTLAAGFNATVDSTVDGKLTVTKAPTATTHVVRKKELDALRSEISGALHYIGVTDKIPTDESTINIYEINDEGTFTLKPKDVTDGDVVLVGQLDEDGNIIYTDENGSPTTDGREYIYNGNTWTYYGAYANYIPKMEYESEQEKLNKALFKDGEVPQWSDNNPDDNAKSLQTQLETKIEQESTNRKDSDKYITGLKTTIPTSGTYANSNETLRDDLGNEITAREDADKNINKAAFGTEKEPEDIDDTNVNAKHSLQKQIYDEIKNRESSDKYITGLETVPTEGTYTDSNKQLRSDLSQEVTNRERVDFSISGLETVPEDYENSNENLAEKIKNINTALDFLADKNVVASPIGMTLTADTIKPQEIGTIITPTYSTTFDSGSYKYGPEPTGVTEDNYNVTFNGETRTTASGSFSQLTVDSTPRILTAEITYSDGNIPKNNLGLDYPEGKIIGDTIDTSLTLSGYRQGCFYGTVTTVDMTVDKITSSLIRGLTKSNKAYTKGNITLSIPKGATAILIACPTTETGPTNVINTTVNAPMTDLYGTSKIVKTLTVAGAGTDPGIEYNVWMYVPAEAYESTAKLTITLG